MFKIEYDCDDFVHYCNELNTKCDLFQKFDDLWELVDRNCSSFVHFDEFIRFFLGEMDEKRKKLVRKVIIITKVVNQVFFSSGM